VPLAEDIWWERVRRRGTDGSRIMSDWSHDMLRVLAAEGVGHRLVDGRWTEIPSEQFTEEYIERETHRLKDELGRRLGVGPVPLSAEVGQPERRLPPPTSAS
jgi:hypothetical protein